ncbi:hypothetical protein FRC11_008547, partial [Ceratobasidium sp. 423]
MKKCKDGYEKHPEYSEGEPGIMNKDDDLTSIGQYELVETRDIEIYNQDLQPAQPLENPTVQVSSSAAPGKSIGQTEQGIPGPDGSNYHILNFADDHNDPMATNPPQLRYNPETKVWIESYPSTMAGMPIQKAMQEEITQYLVGELGDIGELANPDNFEITEFLLQSRLSMKQRECFLNLGKFKGQMPWSSNYKLRQDIDKLPWHSMCEPHYYKTEGSNGKHMEQSWYQNGVEVLREVLGIVLLQDQYHFQPEKCCTTPTKENCQYGKAWRSKAMWETQSKILDKQATVVQY